MATVVHLPDNVVVSPGVGQEEGARHRTTVGVGSVCCKDMLQEVDVATVDGIVKSDHDDLWRVFGRQVSRDILSVTVAIRKFAALFVARYCRRTQWLHCVAFFRGSRDTVGQYVVGRTE